MNLRNRLHRRTQSSAEYRLRYHIETHCRNTLQNTGVNSAATVLHKTNDTQRILLQKRLACRLEYTLSGQYRTERQNLTHFILNPKCDPADFSPSSLSHS